LSIWVTGSYEDATGAAGRHDLPIPGSCRFRNLLGVLSDEVACCRKRLVFPSGFVVRWRLMMRPWDEWKVWGRSGCHAGTAECGEAADRGVGA